VVDEAAWVGGYLASNGSTQLLPLLRFRDETTSTLSLLGLARVGWRGSEGCHLLQEEQSPPQTCWKTHTQDTQAIGRRATSCLPSHQVRATRIVLAGPCPFLSLFSTRGHIADAPLHTHTPHHTTLLSLPHALSLSRPCLVCTERQPGSLWHVCTRVHTPVCHVCSFDGVARKCFTHSHTN
jgi:hypothetical protein